MSKDPIAIAAVRRTNQVYLEQVCRCQRLDCGCAYFNPESPRLPSCNVVGEVLLTSAERDPWEQVEGFYRDKNLTCFRWVPALDQPPDAVEELLAPHGFQRSETIALVLPPEVDCRLDERFRILGARAMRRAYTRVVGERSREVPQLADDLAAVQLERLNDPQYDGFVALLDDEPVGIAAVFQVGEIGRICDLYVAPSQRQRGAARALLSYAVVTARRWGLQPICAQVDAENDGGRALLAKLGFQESGAVVSFWRPDAPHIPDS
jgi:GNAT superfamily N-acetyltransferase